MLTHVLIPLIAYLSLMIVLGWWVGRRVKSADTFFVAGRRLNAALLFATMLAANIGAGSTVVASGLGYRDGIAAWWWVGSAGIGSLALAFWVGPRIWRIAARHDLRTVGDFLELRYGNSVRVVIAVILWLGTLAILAAQIIAMAWVLKEVAGIPKALGCLMGGTVMTLYFAAGGLLSSAWVNLVQLVVLLSGFLLALPFALSAAGGMQAFPLDWSAFWRTGSSGWIYLPLLAPAFIVSPGLLQKIYGARGPRTVQTAVALQGLVLMGFAFIPALLGMASHRLFPELAHNELALPALLVHAVPPLVGGLGLAAILSAEISSADAILYMLATSLSQDLYRRLINPQASDAEVLRVARMAAFAGGAAGIGLAVLLESALQSLTIFYSMLSISLFVPVLAGLYRRRGGPPEALAAVGSGILVLVTAKIGMGGDLLWDVLTPEMAGLAVSGLAFALLAISRARQVKSSLGP